MGKLIFATLIAIMAYSFNISAQALEVKNDFYSADLGSEWLQPNGEKVVDNNYSTVFTNKRHDTVIYLAINQANITSELIAKHTAEQMKLAGATVKEIQGMDNLHFFDYTLDDVKGRYFFKGNPSGYTAVSLYGANINQAQALLKKIKPYGESIIPQ